MLRSDALSAGLPPLATSGRWIVQRDTGLPVLLRGLNRSGLEYAAPAAHSGLLDSLRWTAEEAAAMIRNWGANIVRVPFSQRAVLEGGAGYSSAALLETFDQVIAWHARLGAYTLLDLQWIDERLVFRCGRSGESRVPPLPTPASVDAWRLLARRYRDEPAVLFDLFNEPHDADPAALPAGYTLQGVGDDGTCHPLDDGRVTWERWHAWARAMTRAIRDVHPRALVFVSGVNWAYDLRGAPLTLTAASREPWPDVVYATHVYPWRGGRSRWSRLATAVGLEPTWDAAFGRIAREWPVFVAEWGGYARHVRWGERLRAYLEARQIGWTAWSWSDRPRLVDARGSAYVPTPFGEVVRTALRDGRAGDLVQDRPDRGGPADHGGRPAG